MRSVELQHGAATDVGLVREVNEDAFLAAPPVFVVADGMGGHDGGDVASAIVVEEFARLAETGYDPTRGPEAVAATLDAAQERIARHTADQRAAGHTTYQSGTTVVAALLVEVEGATCWLLANLGDSRAYRAVDDTVEQVSVDHSIVQELVESGTITADDAARHPARNVVTRALGGDQRPEADFFLLPLSSAERLLLCSDGVSGMLADREIAAVLAGAPDPRDAADQVVAAAVAAGGKDNATAVVVDVLGPASAPDDAAGQQASSEDEPGASP